MMIQHRSVPAPTLRLPGAFIRRTDWSGADLTDANLAGADATNALFVGSNFAGANLDGTILRGADLTDSINLTHEQLAKAIVDGTTRLPAYIERSTLNSEPA